MHQATYYKMNKQPVGVPEKSRSGVTSMVRNGHSKNRIDFSDDGLVEEYAFGLNAPYMRSFGGGVRSEKPNYPTGFLQSTAHHNYVHSNQVRTDG